MLTNTASAANDTRPAYVSTASKAALIRAELKSALGLNGRQVSVRASDYSGGSSLYVTVKVPVGLAKVRAIAAKHEDVRVCETTGEILSGCNTYLHVKHAPEATTALRDACEAELTAAAEERRWANWSGFRASKSGGDLWLVDFDGEDECVIRPQATTYGVEHTARRMVEEFLDRRAVADAELATAVAS